MDPSLIASYLKRTRILRAPKSVLATFGATRIEYHLVSPVDDLKNKTRLREGEVVSERPQILTPNAFLERFQGFGDEAKEFAEWIVATNRNLLRSIEYNFKNKDLATRVISESPATVAERIASEIEERLSPHQAVISCPDGGWSLALMKFILDQSANSFPTHVRDFERRGYFNAPQSQEDRHREEIERLFAAAAKGDKAVLSALGRKLHEYGLFSEYEDRYLKYF